MMEHVVNATTGFHPELFIFHFVVGATRFVFDRKSPIWVKHRLNMTRHLGLGNRNLFFLVFHIQRQFHFKQYPNALFLADDLNGAV